MANWGNSFDYCHVVLFVIAITFDFSKKLFENTQTNDKACGHEDNPGLVRLDLLETLQNSCDDVKDIDHFGELQHESNWEEIPPGVSGRLPLVCRVIILFLWN